VVELLVPLRRDWRAEAAAFIRVSAKPSLLAALAIAIATGALFAVRHWPYRHALRGEYFDDVNFKERVLVRYDRRIDFNWGRTGPYWNAKGEWFAVRWTGFLIVPRDGRYEFAAEADDGVRFSLNNQMIIDRWTPQAQTDEATVTLKAGAYPVRLEYFNGALEASLRLFWRPETEPLKVVIPSENFLSSAPGKNQ
jgi:hypothetical protein